MGNDCMALYPNDWYENVETFLLVPDRYCSVAIRNKDRIELVRFAAFLNGSLQKLPSILLAFRINHKHIAQLNSDDLETRS